ncbi:AdoMet dependent proline di-methyltransferase-domain-containing protein [Gautieria morchelliformis]|nr:AdoMet dependent proline di-methyltransferase-domain-containing protein [Gautieria morchelliformis]
MLAEHYRRDDDRRYHRCLCRRFQSHKETRPAAVSQNWPRPDCLPQRNEWAQRGVGPKYHLTTWRTWCGRLRTTTRLWTCYSCMWARVGPKSAMSVPKPDYNEGINYWNEQPASLDGVLGGFGSGTLPRVDALGSRQFVQRLIPALCTVPSAVRPLQPSPRPPRTRALDVGAGIGRVTQTVLLHLFSDVVLLEPVEKFVREAFQNCQDSLGATELPALKRWKGVSDKSKSVTFLQGALQQFDPIHPENNTIGLGRLGFDGGTDTVFDVVWCQWCLGHLSDEDLVLFFHRAKASLRSTSESLIVVKENLCRDQEDGGPRTVYDPQDSSLTRSDAAWLKLFQTAGLTLVRQQVQAGLPEGLYKVKMYALR